MAEINPTIDPGNDANVPTAKRIWKYLCRAQARETDLSLIDDLNIAKLCILQAEAGRPDPWGEAFWKYMGTTYPKWQGVLAERQAYEKLLGPTLAEELQNPLFLSSLAPLVRSAWFTSEPQMRLDFSSPPEPEPVSSKESKKAA